MMRWCDELGLLGDLQVIKQKLEYGGPTPDNDCDDA